MASKSYKEEHPLETRKLESAQVRGKHKDRLPVIVERAPRSTLAQLEKKKFLVPGNLTLAQFLTTVVRKNIRLAPELSLWLFVETNVHGKRKQVLPPATDTLQAIYSTYADEDGFLYFMYSGENVFGSCSS
eukprot:m.154907 g.154907  ORF g.154907 m.154907 type:complete len:131 (-) comp52901_c0_seq2:1756-2148(-)